MLKVVSSSRTITINYLSGLSGQMRTSHQTTIHLSAERRVTSIPLIHGFSTSAFVRPFGLAGRRSHSRARSPGTLNGPLFSSPLNEALAFTARHRASVRSIPSPPRRALRSGMDLVDGRADQPRRLYGRIVDAEEQTSDTRTTARPSRRTAPPPSDRSTLAWSGLLDRMSARTTLPESGQDGRVFARTNLDGWIRQCRWEGSGPSHRRARQR